MQIISLTVAAVVFALAVLVCGHVAHEVGTPLARLVATVRR
jgi:hypothetical protein